MAFNSVQRIDLVVLFIYFVNLLNADPIPGDHFTSADEISGDAYHLQNRWIPTSNLSETILSESHNNEDINETLYDYGFSNLTLTEDHGIAVNLSNLPDCRLQAVNKFVSRRLKELIDGKYNLIEYNLLFNQNYTTNPMLERMRHTHRGDRWSRVATHQGRTLLSLAFNYGILSLMTLKLGTEVMNIELVDEPIGCLGERDEQGKIEIVLELLVRDFREDVDLSLQGTNERVCYERIEDVDGYAKFTVICCGLSEQLDGQSLTCQPCQPNGWLTFLYLMIATVRFFVLAFGPLLFISAVSGLTRDESPYTVKLKDPLLKTIVLCRPDTVLKEEIKATHVLDFSNKRGFPKLRESVYNSPGIGKPFEARIVQYDVLVNYRRLLTENRVPIGFWKSIARSIIFCKLRNLEPFQQCCRANMFRHRLCACIKTPVPWIRFWRKVGLALLVVLLPTPFYIRVTVLYLFEYTEVTSRKLSAHALGLKDHFDYNLLLYLLPTHTVFILIYIVYAVTAVILAYMARRSDEGRFRKIIVGAFTDLKNLSWINVLKMLVANIIWPFRRYGVVGLLVALAYWPVVMPLTVVVYLVYCLPTVYLSVRMFFYSRRAFLEKLQKFGGTRSYRVRKRVDDTMQYFNADFLLGQGEEGEGEQGDQGERGEEEKSSDGVDGGECGGTAARKVLTRQRSRVSDTYELDEVDNLNPSRLSKFRLASAASVYMKSRSCRPRRTLEHLLAASLCVLTLYAVLVVLSECIGSLVEVLVFTMMGIIVNANSLLKYIALLVLVVVYSYDCFNNVEKRYLKLNKALFSEVKGRIKNLDSITSLPSYLQENHGFKSQELNEQADYEMPDDVTDKPVRHWMINDLVLFIDNEDMPRIPKKLFEDVCQIRVAGVPGPVYIGLIHAVKRFLKIIIFVIFIFVVILSFGSIYEVSSTNQMLAALAGGSLPMIMRTFMEPEKPEIEMGTVSFKSKLDEIIKNFVQLWPIYDFPFQVRKSEGGEDNGMDKEKDKDNKMDNCKGRINSNDRKKHTGSECRSKSSQSSHEKVDAKPKQNDTKTPSVGLDSVDGRSIEINSNHTNLQHVSDIMDTPPARTPQRVCFREASVAAPVTRVDLIIKLPFQHDEVWLDEWSDIVEGDLRMGAKESENGSLDSVFAKAVPL